MHKFSIVIPHYNTPELLSRCLETIPEREDVQIIVVDDNSSPELVDFNSFPGKGRSNVTVIFDKKGGGAGYARNQALNVADGKWVIFVDSDDFIKEDSFQIFDSCYESEADIIMFKVDCVNTDTLIPSSRGGIMINKVISNYIESNYPPISTIPFYNMAPWGKMILLKFLNDNSIRFDEVRVSEDIMFSTKIACLAQSVQVVNSCVYVLTVRQGSLSADLKRNGNKFLSELKIKIQKNKYLKTYNRHQEPLFLDLLNAKKIGWNTFWKSFKLLYNDDMLIAGMSRFIVYEIKKKILKRNCYLYD